MSIRHTILIIGCAVWATTGAACDQNNQENKAPAGSNELETTPAPPPGTTPTAARNTASPGVMPPGHPTTTTPPAAASSQIDGNTLRLSGITMTIPDGWIAEPVSPGPMSPKAVFSLPKADGAQDAGSVRITYFPAMKGKDEMNIDRWLGQTTEPDGTPASREDAKIEQKDIGNVHLTIVDVSGTVKATMRAAPQPNGRMIATIVDHPQGPHFVVASGDAATISKWDKAIHEFLESAKTN